MVSVIVLSVAVIVGTALGGPDSYVRFGPGNEDFPLSVLSLDINTWPKWLGVVVVLVLLSLADVIISQIAMMALYNNIYNSAQVEVTEFSTPLQLQTYAQLMYGMNSIRYILSVKISITQIDLALITTIASQLMTIPVIREKIMEKFKRMAEEHEDDEVELHKLSAHPSTHHPVHDMHISYRR